MNTNDPLDRESRIENLENRLDRIEDRLRSLEGTLAGVPPPQTTPEPDEPTSVEAPAAPVQKRSPLIGLIGRTLVLLGLGFLLRALTEEGILARSAGTVIGLAYALGLLLWADVVGGRGRPRSATFYGLVGILIGFPLLWESTVTYDFLTPGVSVAAATLAALIAYGVSFHRHLGPLAWLTTLGLSATLLTLAWQPGGLIPAAFAVTVMGIAALWIGYIRDWFGLAWVTSFMVDVVLFMALALLFFDRGPEARFALNPAPVLAVQVFALLAYLVSIAARTIGRHRDVITLEVLQSAALLLVGLGGAVFVARSESIALYPLGIGCVVLSAACYGTAFTVLDRRVGGRANFIYYTSLAIVLALFSGALVLAGATMSLLFAALGLLTTWFGLRHSRVTLAGHSVFYIVAAAAFSGLLAAASAAWTGSREIEPWLRIPVLLVFAVGIAVAVAPQITHRRTWGPLAHAPRVLLYVLIVFCAGGLATTLLGRGASALGVAETDTAVTATLRTAVLAVGAFTLAALGKRERFRVALWLVYPVLVVGGIKLLAEDLRTGRPVTLFVSLAVYGGALILAPRLMRRS